MKRNQKRKPVTQERYTVPLVEQIASIGTERERLEVQELVLLEKAMKSDDPGAIILAAKKWKDIEERQATDKKSMLIDPLEQIGAMGYKAKSNSITYQTLRSMARTPIIRAIISTRIEQVSAFTTPQPDKYSPGFIIRRKEHLKKDKGDHIKDDPVIAEITEFMLNCGSTENTWHGDSFDTFIRKVVQDTLTFDQLTFEIIRNRKGKPCEFLATDASTFRIASSYEDDEYMYRDKTRVKGYLPSYVQVLDEVIRAEFYPWELCFGVRNPSSSIYNNGYGQSELEDLITTVTSLLNSDYYNSSFFKQGSAPKGILKVSGNINPDTLHKFRQSWRGMVSGVGNCLHGDSLIWTKESGGLEIENILRGEAERPITIWTGTKWEKARVFKTQEKQVNITNINNGSSLKTSKEHQFATINNEGNFEWVDQKDLKIGTFVLVNKNATIYNNDLNIPKYKGTELTADILEILGWMVGDGSLFYKEWDRIERNGKGSMNLYFHTIKEEWILDKYLNTLQSFGLNAHKKELIKTKEQQEKSKERYGFKSVLDKYISIQLIDKEFARYLIEELEFQTSTDKKVVPPFIFTLPDNYKQAFLKGLFSADGNLEFNDGARLTIRNDELRNQVRNLLISLGVRTANCEGGYKRPSKIEGNEDNQINFLTIKDKDLFFNTIGFLQAHKQPKKSQLLGRPKDSFPIEVIKKYLSLAKEKHRAIYKETKKLTFSRREMHDMFMIIKGVDHCSFYRMMDFLEKVDIKIPQFWNDYYFEKVVSLKETSESIQMYDVEVFDDVHAFVAEGIIIHNSHKTPIIESDKMEFIDLSKNNRDMEYSKFQDYLIKLSCAIYKMDPSEIGFDFGGSGAKPLFEDGGEAKLKYSKDKGLRPLLRFIEAKLNMMIITPLNPEYEIKFVGIDSGDQAQELDSDIKKLGNFMTLNEIRAKNELEALENGDIVLNAHFMQAKQAADQQKQQQEQQGGQMGQEEGSQDENPFMKDSQDENTQDDKDNSRVDNEPENNDDENPFLKGIVESLQKELFI